MLYLYIMYIIVVKVRAVSIIQSNGEREAGTIAPLVDVCVCLCKRFSLDDEYLVYILCTIIVNNFLRTF